MGKTQVLTYSADGQTPVEQFDLVDQLGSAGQIYLEVEKQQYEFASGDATFEVQHGDDLYALLKAQRVMTIEVIKDDVNIFIGEMKFESTQRDEDNARWKFYALQRTKKFIDQAAQTYISPLSVNLSFPTGTYEDVETVLRANAPYTQRAGDLLKKKLSVYESFEDWSGVTKDRGTLSDLSDSYDYTLRDFIMDTCKRWNGAYWVDNANVLHVQSRSKPAMSIDGLDDLIASYVRTGREPLYDAVVIHLADPILPRNGPIGFGTSWAMYTKDGEFLYIFDKSDGEGFSNSNISSLMDKYRYGGTTQWRFPPGGPNAFFTTGYNYQRDRVAPPSVRNPLYVAVPSSYSGKDTIFFPGVESEEQVEDVFADLLGPYEDVTVKFSQIVAIDPFTDLTVRGEHTLVRKVLYDLDELSTTVIAEAK